MTTLKEQIYEQLDVVKEHVEMEDCLTDDTAYDNFVKDIDMLKELVTEQYKWNKL